MCTATLWMSFPDTKKVFTAQRNLNLTEAKRALMGFTQERNRARTEKKTSSSPRVESLSTARTSGIEGAGSSEKMTVQDTVRICSPIMGRSV